MSADVPARVAGSAGRGDARPGAAGPEAAPAGWVRALGLGVLYAALVVMLLLLARAGTGFIYQGF